MQGEQHRCGLARARQTEEGKPEGHRETRRERGREREREEEEKRGEARKETSTGKLCQPPPMPRPSLISLVRHGAVKPGPRCVPHQSRALVHAAPGVLSMARAPAAVYCTVVRTLAFARAVSQPEAAPATALPAGPFSKHCSTSRTYTAAVSGGKGHRVSRLPARHNIAEARRPTPHQRSVDKLVLEERVQM